MEQKKLLLVAISVGLFFVIIIGTALVLLKPAGDENSLIQPKVSGALPGTGTFYPLGSSPEPQPAPINELNPAEPDLYNGGSLLIETEQNIVIAEDKSAVSSSQTIITIEPKSTAGVPGAPANGQAAASPSRTVEPAPVKTPTPVQTQAATQAAPPKPAASSSTTAKTSAPAKTRDDFWVQTGAFTVMSSAENVKQTLADKGITSIIENSSIGGTVYFRVRVGPYTSKNEADYWLNLIKSINGFEGSQVRMIQTVL